MTTHAKHTPGPWRVIPNSRDIVSVKKPGLCPRFIAEVLESLPASSDDHPVFAATDLEIDANARLIAAAPELLEALRGLLANAPRPKGIYSYTLYREAAALYSYTLYREAAARALAKVEGRDK